MHPLRPISAALTLLLATACGSGSDAAHGGAGGGGGTGGALAGTIDGQPWTLSAAYTDSFLTNSTDAWVILRGEPPILTFEREKKRPSCRCAYPGRLASTPSAPTPTAR